MIKVRKLSRYYGDLCAVDELSLTVEPGEVLGLVGPNGAGKTTALHCVCGILPPSSGDVEVAGYSVTRAPQQAKQQLAFIPDTPQLFDYLTVFEHLQFVARVFQLRDWEPRANALLAEFQLDTKRDQLPDALSRGMKQKLAICQAFLHQPQAIVCDEPLSGLDPLGRRNMRAALSSRAAAGASLIISSHQLDLVAAMCTRILIIKEGRALVAGTLEEIQRSYARLGSHASFEDVFVAAVSGEGALESSEVIPRLPEGFIADAILDSDDPDAPAV